MIMLYTRLIHYYSQHDRDSQNANKEIKERVQTLTKTYNSQGMIILIMVQWLFVYTVE